LPDHAAARTRGGGRRASATTYRRNGPALCGPCLVGDWTVKNITLSFGNGSSSGGVPGEVDIAPDGRTQLISTGASYTSSSGAGGFRVSGIETFRLDWSAGSDISGRLSVSDDNDTGVTVEIGGHVVRGSGGASAWG
jgi:hypothetical protein